MEKLQQALQKARTQRSEAAMNTVAGQRAAPSASWADLTPLELSTPMLKRNRLVSTQANEEATAFDILRTKVLLMMRKNDWKRLAVTSPTKNNGKTTIATNLALGFSRQPDTRVILLELDLRNPEIAQNLSLPPGPGISEMLSGQVSFAEQALLYRETVAIAAAREKSTDPTALLVNPTTHKTLAQIETDYAPDLMIFDLPPVLIGDDTRAVLKDVDGVLVVALSQDTTIPQLDSCEREIAEHTNVLGVVLNHNR